MAGDENDKNEEEKDLELDLMAEQELLRLTRQYRVMEGDKEAYLEEATKALRRQRKTMEDLEAERDELRQCHKTAASKRNSKKDGENAAKVARLAEEQETLINAMKSEKTVTKDLDTEIRRIERQIGNHLKSAKLIPKTSKPGTNVSREKRDVSQRITLLENRLDGVMINFNATLSQNSVIRKEIDHLVQERSTFNEMISRLQKKIAVNKKTIADITELAIQAFDQRDECQSKIQALQERNEKDAQQYAAELKELQRTLDHDEKLKDFLFNKSNDRVFASQMEEDEKERGKKAAEEKEMEDVQKYKDAFDNIRKIVGADSSLDKIVADFIKVEDQNFALFNYVTEMNNQVEALQEGISRLKGDIKEAKGRGDERERLQREQLEGMEKKLSTSMHEADSAETKLNLMEGVISKLKVGSEDLYLISKVGSTPVLSLLGANIPRDQEPERPFINESNVIMYLDMVHEKIIELKGIAQYLEFKSGKTLAPPITSSSGTSPSVQAMPKAPFKHLLGAEKVLKRAPSSAQILGKSDNDVLDAMDSDDEAVPFDLSALKTRAFVQTQRERREASLTGGQGGAGSKKDSDGLSDTRGGSAKRRSKPKKSK
ncbi:coiled-coil domain-containing protein 63-like [Tigriopus californicus]|uniref:coiled-coil domain-containing protein 63-like n=1 Tax=Tigriopus californicus TaxID=6832 RepID=UPI0027DA887C|nr:coiled-coil domain-containing protein 63-like [Tigriopus californicus]